MYYHEAEVQAHEKNKETIKTRLRQLKIDRVNASFESGSEQSTYIHDLDYEGETTADDPLDSIVLINAITKNSNGDNYTLEETTKTLSGALETLFEYIIDNENEYTQSEYGSHGTIDLYVEDEQIILDVYYSYLETNNEETHHDF